MASTHSGSAGGAFAVSPADLHRTGSAVQRHADAVRGVGQRAGGTTLPSGALGPLAEGTAGGLNGHYQRAAGRINDLAGTMADHGTNLHGTADRYQATEDRTRGEFQRLAGLPADGSGNRPRSPEPRPGGPHGDRPESVVGRDGWGRPYEFDPSRVNSWPVTRPNGEVVGLSFITHPGQQAATNRWANAPQGHGNLYDYLAPGARPQRVTLPQGDNLLLDGHANPQGYGVHVDGQDVHVDGAAFAKIVAASRPFRPFNRANPDRLNLLMANCSAAGRDGDAASSFTSTLAEVTGRPVSTFAGSGKVHIGASTTGQHAMLGTEGRWVALNALPGEPVTTEWPT